MAKESAFEKAHTRRIIAFIMLVILFFFSASVRAFQFQVVDGLSYLQAAQQNSSTKVIVSAARGEIVDRNGVPFTRNKAVFDVELDYAFIEKGNENEVIYKLIKTFEALGEEWIDNLPISYTSPYFFKDGEDAAIARLKKKVDVNEWATAENCMDAIYEIYDYKFRKDKRYKDGQVGIEYLDYSEEYKRKIAGVRYEMITKDFSKNNSRYVFAEAVSPETVAIIEELSEDYPGVFIAERAERTYISGDVASHLIGAIGPIYAEEADAYKEKGYRMNDLVGKTGIEKAMEEELHGIPGELTVVKNSKGEVVSIEETKAPVAGKTVRLTIDFKLQSKLQKELALYIEDFNKTNKKDKFSDQAALCVLDAKTGGVLAMVSYPYYDINDYKNNYTMLAEAEGYPLNNYALSGLYRPGSTFKPITAAAGIDEGIIDESFKVHCDGRYHFYGPTWEPKCLSIGHINVDMNVVSALKYSCNVFFYETGRLLGIDTINKYANYFGLGVDTGIELPAPKGVLSSRETSERNGMRWEEGNVVQAAIGQLDTTITPLQMACEAMTLANHGTRYNVHLVDSIMTHDAKTVVRKIPTTVASSYPMSDRAFDLISRGMIEAGKTIAEPYQVTDLGYDVAVKTGTPEVSSTKTNNCFISFSPVNEPEIAVSFMVKDGDLTNKFLRRVIDAYEESKKNVQK